MKNNFEQAPQEEEIGPEPGIEETDPRSPEEIIKDYEKEGWRHIEQSESPAAIASGKEVDIVKTGGGDRLYFEK